MIALPLMTGVVASEIGCLWLGAFAFFMLRVRQEHRRLRGGFVGCRCVGNCLPAGNSRELVRASELAVAARL